MHIEIFFNLGLVLSNMLFMFIRGLTKHKIFVGNYIDERKKLNFIDTLAALSTLTGPWNNEILPLLISFALWLSPIGSFDPS